MKYKPVEEEHDLFWFAINYRTAGLHSAQGEWIALESYFDKQLQAAYEAGRASREGEVEALQAERNEYKGRMQRLMTTGLELRKEIEALRADAERLDWLTAQGQSGFPWHARLSLIGRGYRLHQGSHAGEFYTPRQAIDEARKEK